MTHADRETSGAAAEPAAAASPPPLSPADLRWRCDAERLPLATTAEVEPAPGVIGQDSAIDALRFGLETRAAGQNVFVRGLMGTGRMTLVRRVLEELSPTCPGARDRCYVHNFAQPDRPRLISLPQGRGRRFRRLVDEMADFIRDDLRRALGAERIRARKAEIDQHAEDQVQAIVGPFERALSEAGLALVTLPTGTVGHTVIFPVVEDKPVAPQEFELLHEQGKVSNEQLEHFRQQREAFEKQLAEIHRAVHDIRRRHAETVGPLLEGEARSILAEFVARIIAEFAEPEIKTFLSELIDDVVEHRLQALGDEEQEDFTSSYRVNVLLQQTDAETCPIIVENTPTMTNLLGAVDRESGPMGMFRSDHMMIRTGSLLRADGGYLILEARDVLTEPGAWKVLVRTLRSGRLEIVPPEMSYPWLSPSLKPEPIDVNVKVVLLGDAGLYYLLDAADEDFSNLFKVLADFDTVIPRDEQGVHHYASVLARIARDEALPPLDRTAVAALVEHGARIAAKGSKLTARFGRVADIAREGAFIATKTNSLSVSGNDILEAIRRTKRRADLPSRRFRELLADGTICVQTSGSVVGQINGLAVLQAGPLTFGFPARITATIGPGTAGVINIEREAALSGAIHTKGFYILGGLLRRLLQTDHPLAFDASVAFEQSYGGIDGDSASGAEICCLLSALTEIPIRQNLAMTGAIDQVGHLLAIGAVNEKIEGYFDTCCDAGTLDGAGVIIPRSNANDLMLRHDVVEAGREGRFHVYAVGTVHEAIALMTGLPPGARDEHGNYPEGSVLALAVTRAREYWLKAAAPRRLGPPSQEPAQQEAGSKPGGTAPRRSPPATRRAMATIAFIGDVMLGRGVDALIGRGPPESFWGDVLPVLRAADAVVANLECAITAHTQPWSKTPKVFHFRARPEAVAVLRAANVRCVSLANNHTLDYQVTGLLDTLSHLETADIRYAGAGPDRDTARAIAVIDAGDVRLGMAAFTDNEPPFAAGPARPGTSYLEIDGAAEARRLIERAVADGREAGANLMVLSVHWGPNMVVSPPPRFRDFARAAIERGVDLVFGHSAHVFQGVEVYRQRPILYDTGDFLDDYAVDAALRNDWSFIFLLDVDGARMRRLRLRPVRLTYGEVNFAAGDELDAIRRRMRALCGDFGTPMTDTEEGLEITL